MVFCLSIINKLELMQNYKTYKIISLTKKQPIFICRAIPVNQQAHFSQQLQQISKHEKHNFFATRQKMIKDAERIIKKGDSSQNIHISQKRAVSLQFPKQEKLLSEIRQMDEKRRKQKSIKQYLRLVYNRAERERRSNSYRLPKLKKGQSQDGIGTQKGQNKSNQFSSQDLKEVNSMKRKMRSIRSRLKLGHEQNYSQPKYQFKMDKLTGWVEKQEEQLAFIS